MRSKILIAFVLALGMFAVVQAQQGRGGFGGMQGGVTQLVTQKAVQEDLKMTDEQVTKVGEWAKDFRAKATEIMKDKGVDFTGGGKGGKGGGNNPEMAEKMAAATAEVNKVAFKELGDVLKKDQVERLKQIEIQSMGVSAFADPEVVEALKLNDSQKVSVKGMVGDMAKDRREIMTEAGLGGGNFKKGGGGAAPDMEKMQEAQKKIQKVQKEYVAKAVDLLNDDQKKTYKAMIGTPFDLSKLTMGGGGRRTKQE